MSENQLATMFQGGGNIAVPAYAAEDGDLGNENVGANDQAIPRISLLQSLSPQVIEQSVEGAMPGLLFNTVSEELFKSMYVVNLFYVVIWGVMKKKKLGGGFHGNYDTEEAANAHVETLPGNAEDYEVMETAKHTVLILDAQGEVQSPAEILMKKSNLPVSRKWNSNIQQNAKGSPRFSLVWELSGKLRKGEGFTWHVFHCELAGATPETVYVEAKDFYNAMRGTQ
jgi:hypothetical protein